MIRTRRQIVRALADAEMRALITRARRAIHATRIKITAEADARVAAAETRASEAEARLEQSRRVAGQEIHWRRQAEARESVAVNRANLLAQQLHDTRRSFDCYVREK